MSGVTSQIWTYTLTSGTIVIDESLGLVVLSVLVTSGSCVIEGSRPAGTFTHTPITLTQGQGMTITSEGQILAGTTITSSGTTILSGR
jgi:hypothetical protein